MKMSETLKPLYIIGAGGFGREVAWLVERINEKEPTWDLKGFLDDNTQKHGTTEGGYKVLGSCDFLKESPENSWVVSAVGNAKVRKAIIDRISTYENVKFATLVDPSVMYSKRVSIGAGSIICAGTILTVDIVIGNHVIINLDCTVGHDAVIEDYVTLYPSVNVSGMTIIRHTTEIGTGANIIQGRNITNNTIIGAGAVIISDIENSGTYVGIPAKRVIQN